jgi:hypothetical protein
MQRTASKRIFPRFFAAAGSDASERNGIQVEAIAMIGPDTDKVFTGSIPRLYETHLVPLIFEPYAADLAYRLALRTVTRVLEIAAGTVAPRCGQYRGWT